MSHSSKEEIARRTEAAVRDRSMLRLMVLGVLVFSLVITLFARLFYYDNLRLYYWKRSNPVAFHAPPCSKRCAKPPSCLGE